MYGFVVKLKLDVFRFSRRQLSQSERIVGCQHEGIAERITKRVRYCAYEGAILNRQLGNQAFVYLPVLLREDSMQRPDSNVLHVYIASVFCRRNRSRRSCGRIDGLTL